MRRLLVLVFAASAGCASVHVPPLTVAAVHVRQITAEQGLSCDYVQNVAYTAKLTGIGKSYELVHEAGENGLRNMVASVGGNAYVYTRTEADELWGRINYAGEVFKCPSRASSMPSPQ